MSTVTLRLIPVGPLALSLAYPTRPLRVSEKSYARFAATTPSVVSAEEFRIRQAVRQRLFGRRFRDQTEQTPAELALMQAEPGRFYRPPLQRVSPHRISELFVEDRDVEDEPSLTSAVQA